MAAWLQQHVPTVNDSGKGDWGDSSRTGMPRRQKVTRCSSAGTRMADALSKADFRRFRAEPEKAALRSEPAAVPLAMMAWVARPVIEDELGTRILRELARTGLDLPGYSQ